MKLSLEEEEDLVDQIRLNHLPITNIVNPTRGQFGLYMFF